MKRRNFLFRSVQAATLLSPVLFWRRAKADPTFPSRAFIWVCSSGYPTREAFFPSGGERDFQLATILAGCEPIKDQLTIVEGIDLPGDGPNPKGNNHVRSMGLVLTAKDVLTVADSQNGDAGGPSIDQVIADELGLSTLELMIHDEDRNHMRGRPFATGPRAFKTPIVTPSQAYGRIFGDMTANPSGDPVAEQRARNRLLARRSVLDELTGELRRLRTELGNTERLKLDIHEDAIRRAEQSVSRDLQTEIMRTDTACEAPSAPDDDRFIPTRAQAQMDLAYAALLCDQVQIASVLVGYSGYHWRYQWIDGLVTDDIHDSVHHRAGVMADEFVRSSRWDWNLFSAFVARLRDTPDGPGTMLDNTLVLGTSNFGRHHQLGSIPFVIAGSAAGQLQPGRFLQVDCDNGKPLTSIAHLMGAMIPGIGNDDNCGPLSELHS